MARAGDPASLSLGDIAFGESLIRVSAHLDNALAFYRVAESSRALVHANRSLELMPLISRGLWRYPELATSLNHSVAAVASAIRSRRPAGEVAAALEAYDALSARSVHAAVGERATSPAYRASVVIALLRTATAAHDAGIHEDARALVSRARSLSAGLWGGAIAPDVIEATFEQLAATIRSGGHPREGVRNAVSAIATLLHDAFGAVTDLEAGPLEMSGQVIELLEEARAAAEAGDAYRADKLLAQAYVEGYAGLRGFLAAWEPEPELNELLGSRLRLAVAAGEPIDDLIYRARDLLAAAPL